MQLHVHGVLAGGLDLVLAQRDAVLVQAAAVSDHGRACLLPFVRLKNLCGRPRQREDAEFIVLAAWLIC